MFAPVRLLYGARPRAPLGLLMADAVVAGMFVATPFLVPEGLRAAAGLGDGAARGGQRR